jgi:hypothetical protein
MRRGTQSTPFSAASAKNSATSAVSFIYLSPLNRVLTQALHSPSTLQRDIRCCRSTELYRHAVAIYKKIRSTSPVRKKSREYLYIIESANLDGLAIYSKGKLVREAREDVYYFLISSKTAL